MNAAKQLFDGLLQLLQLLLQLLLAAAGGVNRQEDRAPTRDADRRHALPILAQRLWEVSPHISLRPALRLRHASLQQTKRPILQDGDGDGDTHPYLPRFRSAGGA